MAQNKKLQTGIISLAIIVIICYMLIKLIGVRSLFALKMIVKVRFPKLLALTVSGVLVTSASLVFQSIVNNRILTPSMLGFDAIYIAIQTIIIFLLGSVNFLLNPIYNFILSTGLMIIVTLIMYRLVLQKSKNNVVILLLIGLILTTFLNNMVTFLQSIMSPDEYLNLSAGISISLTNMNLDLVLIALPIMITCIVLFYCDAKRLEIISLGEDNAINLGLSYNKEVIKHLIYIAISMAIATALVGPLSFLGLIVVNLTREIFKTNNYKILIIFSGLLAIIFLLLGITILEIVGHITTLPVIINLIGGIYLFYIVIKENKI
ncbi:MAG: iron chelate uptake ABC transporter family permease subunit [Acholeplasmataceae bacterium]|nr:iron chelate uptake ABC transporter family permease subunit [Acholeplasmataceae bacterium]HQD92709.1 iron chelate uptake ABC transporter family permease subunit [Bacilli bacterium]